MSIFNFRLFHLWIFLLVACLKLEGEEFPFIPPKNFVLDPSYIGLHHPVTTSNQLAQLYFDQGLTLVYAFNHDAAYWSFLRATEVDPQLAMAYWGMALALGPNINMNITPKRAQVAQDAVSKALDLKNNSSEWEQDYIKALATRYSNDPHADLKQLALNYSEAMRQLSQKYPDDPDAAVLFAESLLDLRPWNQWSPDGKPFAGTLEAVAKLESVLKRDPNHIGANHYYIHAIEASNFPEKALMCALRLKTLLPISGHILHMPSHIYMLVGDYHQAALSNEEAVAIDRAYINKYGIGGIYPVHYLSHNLYFLSRAYTIEGRFGDAKRAANDLTALYLPHFHRMPELEFYAMGPLFVLLRFQHWQEILDYPKPNSDMEMTTVLWHFSRAIAFIKLGDREAAEKERQLFLEGKSQLPASVTFGNNPSDKVLQIAAYLLDAQFGSREQAISLVRQAIVAEDSLSYNEPPEWFYPIRETLGALLLKQGNALEAEQVFRDELSRHPRSGRALFGLKESLMAQSKLADAYWVDQEFKKAWFYSDIDLTIDQL